MKGIIIEIFRDRRIFLEANPDEITYKNIRFTNKFNDKFPQDKIFYESEDYIIVFDGFLLDKMQWFKQYNVFTMNKLIEKIFFVSRKSGGSFKSIIENFRGSFSGAFLEKKSED